MSDHANSTPLVTPPNDSGISTPNAPLQLSLPGINGTCASDILQLLFTLREAIPLDVLTAVTKKFTRYNNKGERVIAYYFDAPYKIQDILTTLVQLSGGGWVAFDDEDRVTLPERVASKIEEYLDVEMAHEVSFSYLSHAWHTTPKRDELASILRKLHSLRKTKERIQTTEEMETWLSIASFIRWKGGCDGRTHSGEILDDIGPKLVEPHLRIVYLRERLLRDENFKGNFEEARSIYEKEQPRTPAVNAYFGLVCVIAANKFRKPDLLSNVAFGASDLERSIQSHIEFTRASLIRSAYGFS